MSAKKFIQLYKTVKMNNLHARVKALEAASKNTKPPPTKLQKNQITGAKKQLKKAESNLKEEQSKLVST